MINGIDDTVFYPYYPKGFIINILDVSLWFRLVEEIKDVNFFFLPKKDEKVVHSA